MLDTQTTCNCHVVQQGVWHSQQHFRAPRNPASYRYNDPSGKKRKQRKCFGGKNGFTLLSVWSMKYIFFLCAGFFYGDNSVLCGECQWAAVVCH